MIETILCLLPIEEAARTSILSRDWRYKWTKIPKLVFCHSTVYETTIEEKQPKQIFDAVSARKNMDPTSKFLNAIYQVLLLRQGPIQEFTLKMDSFCLDSEIDQIILHLSNNHTILKLTLELDGYDLPMSLFSLHQLTDLSLKACNINHKPIFNGFRSLTSLSLTWVDISIESLVHLLSNCPSLKSFSLLAFDEEYWSYDIPTVMEFLKCVPMIEHLTTSCLFSTYGVRVPIPEELQTSLIHLKYFCYKNMVIAESDSWTFLSVLIKCSPNLEKIKLTMFHDVEDCDEESVTFEEYPNVWLEHLNEVEIKDFTKFKPELEFVKFILARSPNLKKMMLLTWMADNNNEELELLKILSSTPRASPSVEIIAKNRYIARC